MAASPSTIKVTNDALADELAKAGQRLIELSLQVRAGFDVPIEYSAVRDELSDDYEAGFAEGFHHGVSSPRGAAEDDRAQGEPSDAQVEAAHAAFWASGDVTGGHDAIRAALRAAGGVR